MRSWARTTALAVGALALLLGSPLAEARSRDRIADLDVGDQGTYVEWAPVVCIKKRSKLKFEAKYKNLRTNATRIYDGWSKRRQGKGCKRYHLRLKESKFVKGDEYRTVLTVYLRSGFIRSKYRTFTVD